MAKKLGRKARKFAKKNLQSVYKRKRKLKSFFKKRASKRDEQEVVENEQEKKDQDNGRKMGVEDIEDTSLDGMLSDESDASGDESESDGYLSEGSGCTYTDENGTDTKLEDGDDENNGDSDVSMQNREMQLEVKKKMKKLERLRQKDSGFCKFLESYENGLEEIMNEDDYSEDEAINEGIQDSPKFGTGGSETKLLTTSGLDFLCRQVKEQNSLSALTMLVNGYRSACHFGTESSVVLDDSLFRRIQDGDAFSKIIIFMLQEADIIFRGILGISNSNSRKESILELKDTSKWKKLKPLLKSFLRSTIFLLNQVTDSELLTFSLSQMRAYIVYFAAFPALLGRVIKVVVNMWATGKGNLTSHAFLFIQNLVVVFGSDWFDRCLIKMYKAFVAHCKFLQLLLFEHIQFLQNSFIELCSQDMQKSSSKAVEAVQCLAKILRLGLQTKKKEALKKICSCQYTNCIDLWVSFIAVNVRDYDLQPLLYIVVQIINGMVHLFPSPRYLPLRHKCIQWLNRLSSSSGTFIPIASYALDILEYKTGKVSGKSGKAHANTVDKLMLKSSSWGWYKEEVGIWGNSSFTASGLLEQINTTKDTSDFLWYTISINMPGSAKAFLNIDSLGHAALVFLNKRIVGFGYGNHDSANFSINEMISLNEGNNSLDILSMIFGVQNFGPWFDIQGAGIFSVNLVNLSKHKQDLTSNDWTYQVGLKGEYLGLDNVSLANSSLWENGPLPPINTTLIWYKTTFIAPEGWPPLALDLSSMGKGQAWVNGQSIGRYWPASVSPSKGCTEHCDYRGSYDDRKCQRKCGQPTQTLYHVPRSWVHTGENLLVLHEELGGDPTKISVAARTSQEICTFISENDPPPAYSWKPNLAFTSQTPVAQLRCERGWHITSINFASFGSPIGTCGAFSIGVCHADIRSIVHKACVGREECSIPVSTANLGDPCPGSPKSLATEVVCSG